MYLIAIEGISQSGKTTLVQKLIQQFSTLGFTTLNVNQHLVNDPVLSLLRGITHPAENVLYPLEELMLYSTRLHRKCHYIMTLGLDKDVVIVDRFSLSILVLLCSVRNIPEPDVLQILKLATSGIIPDLTVVLDLHTSTFQEAKNHKRSRKNESIRDKSEEYKRGYIKYMDVGTRNSLLISQSDVDLRSQSIIDHFKMNR